jgi:glutathione S-transferase
MSSDLAKLYYFHGRGRVQQSRWAMAAAKIPFTNVCLSTSAEFAQLCEVPGKLSYGQVPMLELPDGQCLSQSMAIVRHATRVGELYGTGHEEAARVDEVLEGIQDARGPIISFPFMNAQEACSRLHGSVQRFFPCFEALIERNASPPYAVGTALTIADVLLAELVHSTLEALTATFGDEAGSQVLGPFPKCRAVHAHVLALPEITQFMNGPNWFAFPAGQVGKDYVRNVQTVLN